MNSLLIHCPSIWSLWEGRIHVLGLFWIRPFVVKDLLLKLTSFPVRKKIKKNTMDGSAPLPPLGNFEGKKSYNL